MTRNHTRGILALGIICLFIGVGIHPAFAVDTKTSMVNKANEEECWECKEIDNRHLVRLEKQIKRIEVYTKFLLVLSRYNPEIKEKCEEILDVINLNRLWDFPIICAILERIEIQLVSMLYKWEYLIWEFKYNPIIRSIIYGFTGWIFIISLSVSDIIQLLGC